MRESIPVRRAGVSALALLLVFTASAWSALTNGDFEAGSASWTFTPGYVEFEHGVATMLENLDYAEDGTSLSRLEQTFTPAASDAALSFDYRITLEGTGGTETDTFLVSLNGTQYTVASTEEADSAGDYTSGTWSHDFSGLGPGPVTLAFLLAGEDDLFITTVEIDNVTVAGGAAPIPAPGALVLAGLGTAALGCLRRRKAL